MLGEDGKFHCYGYDAVGSFDEAPYGAQGSGNQLITPVLDNICKRNPEMTEDEATKLILETMNGCSSRDIFTGDKCQIMILKANGVCITSEQDLRKD